MIYKLRELKGVDELGGTMRLGAYPCKLAEGSIARAAYGEAEISERHRHRYEFNREFEATLKEHGLRLAGETPDGVYVEICELADHPWYLGCQFHPEFKSRPLEPHPLFHFCLRRRGTEHRKPKWKTRRARPADASLTLTIDGVEVYRAPNPVNVRADLRPTEPRMSMSGPPKATEPRMLMSVPHYSRWPRSIQPRPVRAGIQPAAGG